jgi:hypothetical protein
MAVWEQVMRESIERMNQRYADGDPPESARPETLEKCWALIAELDRDNHVAAVEWRRWRDKARRLEAELKALRGGK